jgi:hypothetical protein
MWRFDRHATISSIDDVCGRARKLRTDRMTDNMMSDKPVEVQSVDRINEIHEMQEFVKFSEYNIVNDHC